MNRTLKVQQKPQGVVRRVLSALMGGTRKAYDMVSIASTSWFQGLISGIWGARDYRTLKRKIMLNPFSFRAYNLITSAFRAIPVQAQTTDANGGIVIDDGHEFVALMRRTPRTVLALLDHLYFGGEIFLHAPESVLTGVEAGKPGEQGIRLIRPDRVLRIVYADGYDGRDSSAPPKAYKVRNARGGVDTILAERVRHFYLYEDPDREGRGWPLASAAARAVEIIATGEDWLKSLNEGRGNMPGFIHHKAKDGMGDEQFERYKREMQEAYKKDREAGLPGLLDGENWGFIANGTTISDAKTIEAELQGLRKIAASLGVMSPLLGDAQNMTYDNLKTSIKALLKLTVLPLLDWWLEGLNATYMPQYGEARLAYDSTKIEELKEDLLDTYSRLFQAAGRPFITANEARAEVGKPLSENAEDDTIWVPLNMLPSSSVALESGLQEGAKSLLDKALHSGDGTAKTIDDIVLNLTTSE